MITRDFINRTRARITEARAALTKFREVGKATIKQLTKIDKQHVADRGRMYDQLGQLADDLVDKLPEEASDADSDRAFAFQEQVNEIAGEIEELTLASSSVEDLDGLLGDSVREAYAALKETEEQLVKVERLAAKLGI